MTNPVAGVETEPVAPGDRLLSMYARLWRLRRSIEQADVDARDVSPIGRLQAMREEYGATERRGHGIGPDQLADIGDRALTALDVYEQVEERRSATKAESIQLEEELLAYAGGLIGARMDVETLTDRRGVIAWDRQGWGRSREVSRASGIIVDKPPDFVLENRLRLLPVDGFRKVIGGAYDIQPLNSIGDPQIALNIEA